MVETRRPVDTFSLRAGIPEPGVAFSVWRFPRAQRAVAIGAEDDAQGRREHAEREIGGGGIAAADVTAGAIYIPILARFLF